MRHVVAWLAWWIALFWLWFLLVGQWNREELVAAAIAAALAAIGAELARSRARFAAWPPRRLWSGVAPALGMVVVDFGILAWALVASLYRRRVTRGELVERESWVAGSADARAWAVLVAALSPNAYVVEVDPDTERVLLHDLVPHRRSEDPV